MTARRFRYGIAVALALCVPDAGRAAPAASGIYGRWLTDTRDGVVEVYRCGLEACGRLAGLQYSGAMPTDWRHDPKCGLVFIWGMKPGPSGADGGHIVNPDTGSVYSAKITLVGPDTLRLRGYLVVALLGGSRTWTRYHGPPIAAGCHLADGL